MYCCWGEGPAGPTPPAHYPLCGFHVAYLSPPFLFVFSPALNCFCNTLAHPLKSLGRPSGPVHSASASAVTALPMCTRSWDVTAVILLYSVPHSRRWPVRTVCCCDLVSALGGAVSSRPSPTSSDQRCLCLNSVQTHWARHLGDYSSLSYFVPVQGASKIRTV